MSRNPFVRALSLLLIVAIVAPSAFLIAPQRASASAVSCIGGLLGIAGVGAVTAVAAVPVSNIPITGATGSTAGSTMGSCINDLILIPAARLAIRIILQKMTASVINWINGNNGTGQPSYVVNLSAHLQGLGDSVALPFINQIAGMPNSPFGTTIATALRSNYMHQTSMGGFLDANKCTLKDSSTNVPAFLAGNWSQGGVGAWFALTTQSQNNPYMFYQSAQSQLNSNVNQAQTNRRQDLLQSSGFLSWCGVTDTATQTQNSAATAYQACQASCTGPVNGVNCGDQCQAVFTAANGKMNFGSSGGINPGDTCTKNGISGNVQTPGSVIKSYTDKALGSGWDQLVSANDLDTAFSQIINALLNKVLGTAGGLLGASKSSGSTPSIVTQLNNYTGSSTMLTNVTGQTVQDISTRITVYTSAWTTITTAANAAKSSLTSLQSFCTTNASTATTQLASATDPVLKASLQTFIDTATAEAAVAQGALTNKVTPVITSAQTASGIAATTQAFALKVPAESLSASASDLSTLIGMPPSITNIANAQTDASVTGGSNANPTGSLTVSGGTLVDQMNLISANAIALETTVCAIPAVGGNSGM